MKHYRLHEFAKFLSGLVAGDFLCLWWLSANGHLPASFLGVTITPDIASVGMIFDAALFIILVYYGWHIGKLPAMRERGYLLIAGAIFGAVALLHLSRLLFNFDLVLGGWEFPTWLSWIGVVITAYLSYMSFHLSARVKR